MKLCVVQTKPIKGDILGNIDHHKTFIDLAVSYGANIVIFPELSLTGYEPTLAQALATNQDDRRFDAFQAMSDTNQVTIGVGVPSQVGDLLGRVGELAAGVALRCHFHNTRNTGYANAAAALAAGVAALDASTGGVGGCPFAPNATGNIATEDLVYLLERMGVDTGVDGAAVAATGLWLGQRLGKQVPALLGHAGPFPPAA
jgi:isopropylmalate/homocitrate/citramalate synthase